MYLKCVFFVYNTRKAFEKNIRFATKILYMEERSLLIKKYIFPVLIILTGIILLNTAIFSGTGSTSQSGTFLMGSLVVIIMGVVTILYIKEIITKKIHLTILAVMFTSCLILGYSTYSSISTTIAQIDLKKKIDSNIKQGLRDIEIIQLEYKKNTDGIAITLKNSKDSF